MLVLFWHLRIREINKFKILYFFPDHVHGHHAKFWKHRCLGAKMVEEKLINLSLLISLTLIIVLSINVDLIQYLDRERWIQLLSCKRLCYEEFAGTDESQAAFTCDLCAKRRFCVIFYGV